MRFKLLTKELRRYKRKQQLMSWHNWFAWRPVRLNEDTMVWLEPMLRRLPYDAKKWQYQTIAGAMEQELTYNEPEPLRKP